MSRHSTWTILLLGLLFSALPKTMFGTEYGIIVDGKLTEHGAIVGQSTRAGDGKDDEAFILNGLYKFGNTSLEFTDTNRFLPQRSRSTQQRKYDGVAR